MGRSENICFRGERSSDGIAGGASRAIGESASGTGTPKMADWSSTNEEIRGAGTLSVGAKTMPTVDGVSIRSLFGDVECEKTYHCEHSSC